MSSALYQDALVAEAKARHGAGRLAAPTASVVRDNPLCGDRITLDLQLAGERIAAVAQETRGCLLTQAAASLVARLAREATPAAFERLHEEVVAMLKESREPAQGELGMFRPVAAVRSRHSCVLLPFEALAEALAQAREPR